MKGEFTKLHSKSPIHLRLTKDFFEHGDVVQISKQLLGKVLVTNLKGTIVKARIVETEAYSWREKGCHAYGAKKTNRNAVMFQSGGIAYVYLCYGIHHLFNIVTNKEEVAEAVLIRAVEPIDGTGIMRSRRGVLRNDFQLTSGPGKLTKAMGIDRTWNGKSLVDDEVWIDDDGYFIAEQAIMSGPRIGIDYAGEDASLPWRFWLRDNKWVSV